MISNQLMISITSSQTVISVTVYIIIFVFYVILFCLALLSSIVSGDFSWTPGCLLFTNIW